MVGEGRCEVCRSTCADEAAVSGPVCPDVDLGRYDLSLPADCCFAAIMSGPVRSAEESP